MDLNTYKSIRETVSFSDIEMNRNKYNNNKIA